ncbi:MAG: FAD-dependent oxidoreductase, partial [Cyanobacteria bacterium K_DeepCast_150m_m2_101]|nr:FAD-dependent oxidoreductase [Cyanobacteria bacterium K_DeepCast_150m_m2_101]
MLRLNELKLPLDHEPEAINEALCRRLKLEANQLLEPPRVVKRSVDARRKSNIQLAYSVEFGLEPGQEQRLLKRFKRDPHLQPAPDTTYQLVAQAPANADLPRPVVVGAGPCGYFCALLLAQMGLKPLLLERGKPVKERSADTFGFWQGKRPFNPESNAQFGEGGAGTFSDG